jgi:hypothetical protein
MSPLLERNVIVGKNTVAFPTARKPYIEAIQRREARQREECRIRHKNALDRLFSPATYSQKDDNSPLDLMDQLRESVHADDRETLRRMAQFIGERTEKRYTHARSRFVQTIAEKNYTQGFDAVRREAFRDDEQRSWSSQRDALGMIGIIGAAEDIEPFKALIPALVQRADGTVLRAAFPALGRLADRVYPYPSQKRHDLRIWLQRFCENPTEREHDHGCQVYAAVALGKLGYPESLPLIDRLNEDNPHPWYEAAALQIRARATAASRPAAARAQLATQPATSPATQPEPVEKPGIQCDSPVHDFGSLMAGPVLRHSFEIRNAGDVVLNITHVRTNCACAVAEGYPGSIQPGESAMYTSMKLSR